MPYLTPRALEGLKEYRYKPGGYTILDSLHQPVWNWITDNILPSWLAPNLITLTGLIALITAYLVTAHQLPDFDETYSTPRWIFYLNAAASFFYLHADCLDGKQARKTKTSSPLGQLFDHGCDALAVFFVLSALMVTLAMPAPPAWPTVGGHLYVFIPWLLAHWEEYHTGMMVYGNGTWGVTEANYAVVFLHLTSGVFGPQMWNTSPMKYNIWAIRMVKKAGNVSPLLASMVQKIVALQMNHALLLLLGYMGLGLFASQVNRVFTVSNQPALLKDTMPKDERGSKQLGPSAAAFHLFQVILFHAVGAALLFQNQSGMYLSGMTRLSLATFGVTYALQATRLIMAHMSKEPFAIALWPVVGQAVQAANLGVYRFADPVVVGWIVNIAVIVGYLHYVTNIISEVCDFLDINALTIKKKNGAVVGGGEKKEKSNGSASVRKRE